MVSAPGAGMLDDKIFIVRETGDWRGLFERWWDGEEWLWVNHGRPAGLDLKPEAPGAAMMDEKLFVVSSNGNLWERQWRDDLFRWVWFDHGRPNNVPIVTGAGAAMMNQKLFVATSDGNLWERHWRADLGRWAWESHGRPGNEPVSFTPGAAMMDEKFFVVTGDGNLWERHWRNDLGRWAWQSHGMPNGKRLNTAPGAAMMDEKLFAGASDGHLWERWWNGSAWVWVDHGRPPGTRVDSAPGAAMMNTKLFVGAKNGKLFERLWNGSQWVWVDHGQPPGTKVRTAPSGAMLNDKLFVGTKNGRMFERFWNGSRWVWVDHGIPLHDQSAHVIDNRSSGPKRDIAVIAEGYAEKDLDKFRSYVQKEIVDGTFTRDLYAEIQAAVNVIRVDLVSLDSGVSTIKFDEQGTPSDSDDDTVERTTFRNSRIGYVHSGSWAHCWIEPLSATGTATLARVLDRFAPDWDFVLVVLNEGDKGGCRRGSFMAVTKKENWAVIAHELGHGLGNLNDEYQAKDKDFTNTNYTGGVNCSISSDRSSIGWTDLIDDETPLPTGGDTPGGWDKNQDVGAFEGCGTFETGLFRPVLKCRMNQNKPPFCPVCERQMRAAHEPFM